MRIACVSSYIGAIVSSLTACALHGWQFWLAVAITLLMLTATLITYFRSTT